MWKIALITVALWAQLDPSTSTMMECTETPKFMLTDSEIVDLEVNTGNPNEYVYIGKALLNDLSTIDAECQKNAMMASTQFMLPDMLKCDPYYSFGNDYILLTWTFRNFPDKTTPTVRFNETCFNRTCRYDTNYLLNTTGGFTVGLEKISFANQQMDGVFKLAIGFYNVDFNAPQTSVVMPGWVYVKVSVTDVSVMNRVFVQLIDCWINDNQDSEVMPKYDVIKNKMLQNALATEEIRNFMPDNARFAFRSFFFTKNNINQEQYVYAHCKVELCDNTIETNCNLRAKRRRRDLSVGGEIPERKQHTVSYGPLRVTDPSEDKEASPCGRNNGRCSDICTVIGNDAVCSCTRGKALMQDGKICGDVTEEHEDHYVELIEKGNTNIIIAAGLIAFALITSSCLFVLFRRLGNGYRMEVKEGLKY